MRKTALGPLARVVTRLADVDLQAAAMLSGRQLRKLRPLAFIGVVGSVLGQRHPTRRPPG